MGPIANAWKGTDVYIITIVFYKTHAWSDVCSRIGVDVAGGVWGYAPPGQFKLEFLGYMRCYFRPF